MGGKGKRRREKNYRAAHGDKNRLPPPPDHSKLDALPTKLRQIMAYANKGSEKSVVNAGKKARGLDGAENKHPPESSVISKGSGILEQNNDDVSEYPPSADNNPDIVHITVDEKKKKKKRKRKQVDDLRLQAEIEKFGGVSKRKERKKEHLKEMKKKKKQKKVTTEDNLDMPRHDEVKFGEVVEGPPKISVVPKARKRPMDASQERLRLQAIEAYRNRKKWASRPGIDIPASGVESEFVE